MSVGRQEVAEIVAWDGSMDQLTVLKLAARWYSVALVSGDLTGATENHLAIYEWMYLNCGSRINTLDFQLDTAKDGKKTRNFVESWDFRFGDANPLEKKIRLCLQKIVSPHFPYSFTSLSRK